MSLRVNEWSWNYNYHGSPSLNKVFHFTSLHYIESLLWIAYSYFLFGILHSIHGIKVAPKLTNTLDRDNREIFLQNMNSLYQVLSLASPCSLLKLSNGRWVLKKPTVVRFLRDPAWVVNWELNISLASSGYLQWESWSACPDVCGVRYHQVRRRICLNPTRKAGGADCSGLRSETRPTGCYTPCLGRLSELFWGIPLHNRYVSTNARWPNDWSLDSEVRVCVNTVRLRMKNEWIVGGHLSTNKPPNWPSDRVTEWPSNRVTEWPSDRVTEWPSDRVTEWLSDSGTNWPSD